MDQAQFTVTLNHVLSFEDPKFDRDKFINKKSYYAKYPKEEKEMFARERKKKALLDKMNINKDSK